MATPSNEQCGMPPDIRQLFCGIGARYGPYEEISPDVDAPTGFPGIKRYMVRRKDGSQKPAWLHIYRGLDSVAGQMWERERRTLVKLSSAQHPALPQIFDGGYDAKGDFAFLVSEAVDFDLSHRDGMPFLREKSRLANTFQQFASLCEGLSLLHGQGILHRNLQPRSIQFINLAESEETTSNYRTTAGSFRLLLGRFEMSVLIRDLLERSLQSGVATEETLFSDYHPDCREIAYYPRERLGFLPQELYPPVEPEFRMSTERSDVYGLGVLAWELFIADFPSALLSSDVLQQDGVTGWHHNLHSHMMRTLNSHECSRHLKDLIRGMLEYDPGNRFWAGEAINHILNHYDELIGNFLYELPEPYLVAFHPDASLETLFKYSEFGLNDRLHGTDEERRITLKHFYENEELKRASLYYSPDGAVRHIQAGTDYEKRKAQYVLVGEKGMYFCAILESEAGFSGRREPLEEILYIKYARPLRMAPMLKNMKFRRTVRQVEAIPWAQGTPRSYLDSVRQKPGRPSWRPLLQSVAFGMSDPSDSSDQNWRETCESALNFLLEFQEVEIRAREYPFERLSTPGLAMDTFDIRYLDDVDAERISHHRSILGTRTGLFQKFREDSRRRPDFANFFQNEPSDSVQFCQADSARPADWRSSGQAYFVTAHTNDVIRIRCRAGHVPARGWLRMTDDGGSVHAWHRQREARAEILQSAVLLGNLYHPRSISGHRQRWLGAGRNLKGNAPERIRDILVAESLYALHGPPGTGKTTVAAHAVHEFLKDDRGGRILVTAQSHHALDNLAIRIRKQLGLNADGASSAEIPYLAIRIVSASREESVNPGMQDVTLDRLTTSLTERIVKECQERIDSRSLSDEAKTILGEWKTTITRIPLELRERVRRGANLVFATCVSATKKNVDTGNRFSDFDWVIVEEAAKAWPLELAIPLVRANRWTLIGDHRQLPAHRREDLDRFLRDCESSPFDELAAYGRNREKYSRWFSLFGSLFDEFGTNGTRRSEFELSKKADRNIPVGVLTEQYRMREPIKETINKPFYDGKLSSDPSTEVDSGVVFPKALREQAVVWIDTEGLPDCDDQYRSNPGEARIVAQLLRSLQLQPNESNRIQDVVNDRLKSGIDRYISDLLPKRKPDGTVDSNLLLAILTPYQDQIRALMQSDLPDRCAACVHSIHEYQGREANIVIVSLVRSVRRGDDDFRNLGFLVQPEIANVMFSRARRLLVIVGRISHFEQSTTCLQNSSNNAPAAVPFWKQICEAVRKGGRVVSAESIFAEEGEDL